MFVKRLLLGQGGGSRIVCPFVVSVFDGFKKMLFKLLIRMFQHKAFFLVLFYINKHVSESFFPPIFSLTVTNKLVSITLYQLNFLTNLLDI